MIKLQEIFEEMNLTDFAEKRLGGATKIANDAKEKGGPAILTFHHFEVKLPYYKEASEGNFDLKKATASYNQYMDVLHKLMKDEQPDAVEFQKIVGLLEVLGELIIKHKTQSVKEHRKYTPNERISKYKERIQKLKDKISKAVDKNSDTVKLQKNQIKVIQQTMNNFRQKQAIKKAQNMEVINLKEEQPHQKEMIDGIVEMLLQVKDIDNRKQMALDRLRDFRQEGIEVNADEFMTRCGLGEMNEKWSAKYKRSIDCSHPKGFSQRAHCQGRKKHEVVEEAMNLFLEKNCPTDPAKWSASVAAAKRKFDVYPSAYANGWAAKNYKSKGGGWRSCK